jgi:hypothetical protein
MLERNKLRLGFLSSLAGGFLLTLAFPFLFGSQIYDSRGWQLLAPSSLLFDRVTTIEQFLSLCVNTLVFGAVIFVAWRVLRWAVHRRSDV